MRKGANISLLIIVYSPEDDLFPVPDFNRLQFQILVCFAVAIKTAQGKSFWETLKVNLRKDRIFYIHLYVAPSKSTHPSQTAVLTEKEDLKPKMK